MIDITGLREDKRPQSSTIVHALLDRLEAAEKDAAHQKALAESALRVAEGWEIKCGELRAKIEHMENQEPVGYGVLYVEPATGEEDWDSIWKYQEFAEDHIKDFTQAYADIGEPVGEITTVPLYALPGAQAQPAPSVPDGWKEGVEAAARLIDQKAELYAIRFGIDDVGGLSFGQGPHAEIKMDHYTSMIELADEVRAMLAAAPEAKP